MACNCLYLKRFGIKNSVISLLLVLFSFVKVSAQHPQDSAVNHNSTEQTVAHAEEHATEAHGGAEEKFNPSEMILEHIADAHDWHLWGHTSIPLPVILYTDKGLEFFSSSKFNHGHDAYQGNYNYKIVHNKIKVVDAEGNVIDADSKKVLDFSITKNVASLLLSVTIILLLFLPLGKTYTKAGIAAPKGRSSFLEPLILFIRDEVARPNLGSNYAKFMPFLLTIFFFILINNALGLIPFFPGGANVSGNIAFTMVLALISFVIININGKKTYWKHVFTPHVPGWMYPLMVPVEIIGLFTKPFALMIRLFANITGGHILILSLVSLIFIFKTSLIATVAVPFVVFISVIELLVAFLQAFIFTMLVSLFIGMAVEEPHGEEHH